MFANPKNTNIYVAFFGVWHPWPICGSLGSADRGLREALHGGVAAPGAARAADGGDAAQDQGAAEATRSDGIIAGNGKPTGA